MGQSVENKKQNKRFLNFQLNSKHIEFLNIVNKTVLSSKLHKLNFIEEKNDNQWN